MRGKHLVLLILSICLLALNTNAHQGASEEHARCHWCLDKKNTVFCPASDEKRLHGKCLQVSHIDECHTTPISSTSFCPVYSAGRLHSTCELCINGGYTWCSDGLNDLSKGFCHDDAQGTGRYWPNGPTATTGGGQAWLFDPKAAKHAHDDEETPFQRDNTPNHQGWCPSGFILRNVAECRGERVAGGVLDHGSGSGLWVMAVLLILVMLWMFWARRNLNSRLAKPSRDE